MVGHMHFTCIFVYCLGAAAATAKLHLLCTSVNTLGSILCTAILQKQCVLCSRAYYAVTVHIRFKGYYLGTGK